MIVYFSEDIINDGEIVIVGVSEEVLKDVETEERVLGKLTGFVEISEEDCPLELPVSEVPLNTVLEEVSVELVD